MSSSEDIQFFLSEKRLHEGGYVNYDKNLKVWSFFTHKPHGSPIQLTVSHVRKLEAALRKWRPVYLDFLKTPSTKEQERFEDVDILSDEDNRVVFFLSVYKFKPNLQLARQYKDYAGTWRFSRGGNLLGDVDPLEFGDYIDKCLADSRRKRQTSSDDDDDDATSDRKKSTRSSDRDSRLRH
jgi:hypothetical protein